MVTTMTALEGHEVLQRSNLDRYPWPETLAANQITRLWTPQDGLAVAAAATRIPLDIERVIAATSHLATPDRILWILSHDAVNFNGVTAVRNEPKWRDRLAACVERGESIPIAYPLFCAIANPAKQITRPGAHAGELASLHWFRHVDSLVRAVYEPGLIIHILSDATLYNNELQNTLAFAYGYIDQAREMVGEAGAAHCVRIHDYAALLAPFAREFDRLYNGFYARLSAGDQTLISAPDRERLIRSIRASVNTERLGLTYEDCGALFGPGGVHPLAPRVEAMAQAALLDQIAVKLACVQLDLPERLWPGHIRASCHKGLKSGVAVVGLRVYPEYYKRSKLLPYHGKPLLRADGRLVVEPEFLPRSRADLVRVENEHGQSLLYCES